MLKAVRHSRVNLSPFAKGTFKRSETHVPELSERSSFKKSAGCGLGAPIHPILAISGFEPPRIQLAGWPSSWSIRFPFRASIAITRSVWPGPSIRKLMSSATKVPTVSGPPLEMKKTSRPTAETGVVI